MILGTNQKIKYVKRPIRDVFLLAKSVTLKEISYLSSFLEVQQINFSAFLVLAVFS